MGCRHPLPFRIDTCVYAHPGWRALRRERSEARQDRLTGGERRGGRRRKFNGKGPYNQARVQSRLSSCLMSRHTCLHLARRKVSLNRATSTANSATSDDPPPRLDRTVQSLRAASPPAGSQIESASASSMIVAPPIRVPSRPDLTLALSRRSALHSQRQRALEWIAPYHGPSLPGSISRSWCRSFKRPSSVTIHSARFHIPCLWIFVPELYVRPSYMQELLVYTGTNLRVNGWITEAVKLW